MSTIVTRAGKGSALTHNEVDANFTNLNTDKIEAAQTVTLTNKTISGSNNTLSNIGNASLTNSSVTIGSTSVSLGSTATTVSGLTLSSPTISGGTVNNAVIGGSTPAAITGTTITANTGFSGPINGTVGGTTPAAGTFTSLTDSGNLTFTGTGNRITGDFSNATLANRVAFQTSTVNGSTSITAIPNGTGTVSALRAVENSDPTNAAFADLLIVQGSDVRLRSDKSGTGTYLPMTFYTGGSERMRVDTSGNVGIGTSSPSQKLHVSSASNTQVYVGTTAGDTASLLLDAKSPSFDGGYSTISNINTANGTSALTFKTRINYTDAERMRIDSSGNVGIGTSSPSPYSSGNRVLHIDGGGNPSEIKLTNNTAGASGASGLLLQMAGNDAYFWNAENSFLSLGTNNTERARIDSSGNLLVGVAALPSGNQRCFIYNPTDQVASIWHNTSNSGTWYLSFHYNGANTGRIERTGATTVAYTTSSDYRLKENVQPMTGALAKVAALKPCTYTWKADGTDGEGFIAHELQSICPHAVTGEKDAVNDDGSIKPQGIDTSFLVATLTAAIQEQQAMIEELKAKVAALESK
jgi:hypothetical protein